MNEEKKSKNWEIKYKNHVINSIIEELRRLGLRVRYESIKKYTLDDLQEFLHIITEIEKALNI